MMNFKNRRAFGLLFCLLMIALPASAETTFPDNMTMGDALSAAIAHVSKSDYKDLEVSTKSGSVSGEFVKLSGNILVLKQKTGSFNMKANKEKVFYTMLDVNSIIAISYYSLD